MEAMSERFESEFFGGVAEEGDRLIVSTSLGGDPRGGLGEPLAIGGDLRGGTIGNSVETAFWI